MSDLTAAFRAELDAALEAERQRMVSAVLEAMSKTIPREVLTAAEAQEFLNVSHVTLKRLRDSGGLKFVRMGGSKGAHVQYRLTDLREFLEHRTEGGNA